MFSFSAVACRTHCYRNRSTNRKPFNINALAVGGMSGSSSIAEIPYNRFQKGLCCGWVEMRLADFGGICSFEAVLVDLQ
jgi:hypothetical protein